VWWICSKGHEWDSTICNRSNGRGCPKCSKRTSFPEQAIYYYLSNYFQNVFNGAKVDGIEIDIYLEEYKIGIEYDGYFFHKNHYERDVKKSRNLLLKDIKIIRIRESPLIQLNMDGVIEYSANYNDLKSTLIWLFKELEYLTNKKLNIEFDLNEDSIKIIERYKFTIMENSVGNHLFLYNEWNQEKNLNLDPYTFSLGSGKKVWWICEKGHEWQAKIIKRKRGDGCPYCCGKRVCIDNCIATLRPEIAEEWHHIRNENLTPYDFTLNSNKSVWWRCRIYPKHEWKTSISNRCSQGSGCPYCSGHLASEENNLFLSNPQLSKEWHPILNGDLTPYNVSHYSSKVIWWLCDKGHEWEKSIFRRTVRGQNCPKCKKEKSIKNIIVSEVSIQ
jgi:very-short-patch-repair endonuclease